MGWRLGRRPGLDGLRGVAILLVVVTHLFAFFGATSPRMFGQNGVQVFFVLSGFLITSLLLDGIEASGRLDLRAFYGRRARRLAPALFVVVAVVLALCPWLGSWWTTPRQLLAAATWTSNWVAPSSTAGHALAHTWSLAIEEQFYLAWPVVLFALTRAPECVRLGIMWALVTLGVAWPALGVNPWSYDLYYGTDTRSLPLLAGALLAMLMRRRLEGAPSPLVPLGALGSIVVLAAVWQEPLVMKYAEPQVVTGLAVLAIWGCAQATSVPILSGRVLGYVGRRSYALYLWHPVIFWLLIRGGVTAPVGLLVLGVPLAFAVTEASWRLVELPVLGRRSEKPVQREPRAALEVRAAG